MSTSILCFDIETGPADAATLKEFEPEFEAPKNIKDPVKIAAAIEEKRAEWVERAPLSPIVGRVLAIGYQTNIDGQSARWSEYVSDTLDERTLIARFFERVVDANMGASYKLMGYAIHDFDLPFLVRRALALGIPIPTGMLPTPGQRFYWPSWFIDLRQIWGMGEYQPSGSLDVIGRFLGLGGKAGKGKDFFRLFYGTADEHRQAIAYLDRDIELTWAVARKLGVVQ